MSAIKPWNDWYHCMGNTYGTWLRGDQRGFRTRHHREHIEGDYKHRPAAGRYDAELRQSLSSMTRMPVELSATLRQFVCRTFGGALLFHHAEFVDLCVGAEHFHVLARFTGCDRVKVSGRPTAGGGGRSIGGRSAFEVDPLSRLVLGRAKSFVSHQVKKDGRFAEFDGGLWGKRTQIEPIADEGHWRYVGCEYIPAHANKEGAAVWSLLDKEP